MKIKSYSPEEISYRNQRRSVGMLGIFLPFALIFYTYLQGCREIQPSISQYFYSTAGILLVGVLSAVGLFLISYKGPQKIDDIITNLAGIFALGIAYFPTDSDPNSQCLLFSFPPNKIITIAHYIFAALFFISLAINSFFLFTRTDKKMITKQKQQRNYVYKTCGILILIFIALVPICNIEKIKTWLNLPYATFILEALALLTFGISWLIKGDTLLQDQAQPQMVKANPADIVAPNAE
ncbi:MAG: hypothetical protein EOO42_05730 [Flavobacteriales bacterium]|nr:MAG: hypothetical protein EOO42_05730 [Flavobacteriales bacterium]